MAVFLFAYGTYNGIELLQDTQIHLLFYVLNKIKPQVIFKGDSYNLKSSAF